MISCVSERDCTGCGACRNKCPAKAITMRVNEKGFLQPYVEAEKCCGCNLCDRACPVLNPAGQKELLKLAGGYCRDRAIVAKSSSGGAFYALASRIIAEGGIVIGAAWDSQFLPYHKAAFKREELDEMHGSKYVQSDKREIYREIEQYLKEGKKLLFTGTPCECLAVKNYLGRAYENLYLVEFICHGIPSPGIWKEHLRSICGAENIKPTEVNFRSKERKGWHSFELKIAQNDRALYYPLREDLFFNGFTENLFLRECCYACRCKDKKTEADISIADFWGSERYSPELDRDSGNEGLSLVACFSEKGIGLFTDVCGEGGFIYEVLTSPDAYADNTAAMLPAKRNRHTKSFYRLRERYETAQALKRYARYTFRKKLCNKVVWKIRAILKK